jgi:hypothetical protein
MSLALEDHRFVCRTARFHMTDNRKSWKWKYLRNIGLFTNPITKKYIRGLIYDYVRRFAHLHTTASEYVTAEICIESGALPNAMS